MAQIVQLVLHCMKFLIIRHGWVVRMVANCVAGMLSFAKISFQCLLFDHTLDSPSIWKSYPSSSTIWRGRCPVWYRFQNSFLNSIVKEIVLADTLYVYLFSRRSACSSLVKLRILIIVPFLRQWDYNIDECWLKLIVRKIGFLKISCPRHGISNCQCPRNRIS